MEAVLRSSHRMKERVKQETEDTSVQTNTLTQLGFLQSWQKKKRGVLTSILT